MNHSGENHNNLDARVDCKALVDVSRMTKASKSKSKSNTTAATNKGKRGSNSAASSDAEGTNSSASKGKKGELFTFLQCILISTSSRVYIRCARSEKLNANEANRTVSSLSHAVCRRNSLLFRFAMLMMPFMISHI